MDFRRNAERRRRVLREDLSAAQTAQPISKVQRVGRYDGRRTLQRQPKLIDLIPTNSWIVWPVCVCLLVLVTGLIFLNARLPVQQAESSQEFLASTEIFQLSAPGSIAQTVLLSCSILSALICFQTFFVRRHRQDDYLGQYQIWKWLSIFFCCMALGNLPWFKALATGIIQATTPEVYHPLAAKLALGTGLFMLLGVGARTFIEVKESVSSSFCIMAATVTSALGILLLPELQTGLLSLPALIHLPTETSFGLWLVGNVFFFCSFFMYLSYVHKDVQGKILASRKNRKEKAEPIQEDQPSPQKKTQRATRAKSKPKPISTEEDAAEQPKPSTRRKTKSVGSFDQLAAQLEPEDGQPTGKKTRSRKRKNAA